MIIRSRQMSQFEHCSREPDHVIPAKPRPTSLGLGVSLCLGFEAESAVLTLQQGRKTKANYAHHYRSRLWFLAMTPRQRLSQMQHDTTMLGKAKRKLMKFHAARPPTVQIIEEVRIRLPNKPLRRAR